MKQEIKKEGSSTKKKEAEARYITELRTVSHLFFQASRHNTMHYHGAIPSADTKYYKVIIIKCTASNNNNNGGVKSTTTIILYKLFMCKYFLFLFLFSTRKM